MPQDLIIRGEHITLSQALKKTGLAETGGQAKLLVREGQVRVNDEVETKPGRKLFPGDRLQMGNQVWILGQ